MKFKQHLYYWHIVINMNVALKCNVAVMVERGTELNTYGTLNSLLYPGLGTRYSTS